MKSLDPNRPNVTRWGYKALDHGVLVMWAGGGTIPIANAQGLGILEQYLDIPLPKIILFRCPHGAWIAALRNKPIPWRPLWTFMDLFQGPPGKWTAREKLFHLMLARAGVRNQTITEEENNDAE